MEPITEEITAPTEAPLAPQKKERSQAQKDALAAARARALQVRKENAELKSKEKAVKSHQKKEQTRQIEQAYQALPKPEIPEEEDDPWSDEAFAKIEKLPAPYASRASAPKKRKPARRIVVTEVSSEEDVEDVEVVLPKAPRSRPVPPPPSQEEMHYQAAMNKMFHLSI